MNIELKPEVETIVLNELRALRLWHWKEYMMLMRKCNWHKLRSHNVINPDSKLYHEGVSQGFWQAASIHIKAVQTLNVFFPEIGDTAEQDERKEANDISLL